VVSQYRLRRRVQFYETDSAGIVHFSWFYRYMEEAEHALWREAGLSIAPREAEVAFPRVSASFDFRRPLFFEDEFEVLLSVTEIRRRSIRYRADVTRDGTAIATGTLAIACVRKGPGGLEATEIPPEVARRFAVAPPADEGRS